MQLLCGDIYWRADRGTRSQRRFGPVLIGSLLFHCMMGGVICAMNLHRPLSQEPIMIDLTAAPLAETEQHQRVPRAAAGGRRPQPAPARPAPVAPPPLPAPVAMKQNASPATAPATTQAVAAQNQATGNGNSAVAVPSGTGASTTATGDNRSQASGTGQLPVSSETLQKRYLREHFAYIRDLIGKELRYPRQAIRMGWSGRVTVSFLVLVDGTVADLRINHTSGIPLLDRNALETVRRAAPFPRPPVSARLMMPVDYILE